MKKILLFILLPIICLSGFAQFKNASYAISGKSMPYKLMLPENYDPAKRYPLVVFLHGGGERGNDNEAQLVHGKQFLIDHFQSAYPAIVLVPQCPKDSYWSNVSRHQIEGEAIDFRFGITDEPSEAMVLLTALVDNWLVSGKVDLSRVYVGGLSMGAMGTFELLWRMPGVFTAAFPICGGADMSKLSLYANNTAVWIFHGDADVVVPVDLSRGAYAKLKEMGCNVKYTEYKGVNHNSWDNTFNEKDLVPWLFSHKK